MASVVERGGRYCVRVRKEGFKPVNKTFSRRSDAVAWGKKVEVLMESGTWIEEGQKVPSFAEALTTYRAAVVQGMKGADTYTWALDDVAAQDFARKAVCEVTAGDLAGWRDSMVARGLEAGTIVRRMGLVSGFLSWCWKERGWLTANTLASVRKPKVSDARDRVLTADETRLLLAGAEGGRSTWLHDALVVLLQTALRRGELCSLTVADLDTSQSVVRLRDGKTGARVVPLSPAACEALQRLATTATAAADKQRRLGRKDVPAVGAERLIPVADAPAVSLAFKRAVKRGQALHRAECEGRGVAPDAGFLVGVRVHDLRHTAVTAWAAAGLSVHELQLVSGHKTVTMLSRYVNLKPADLAAKLGRLQAA